MKKLVQYFVPFAVVIISIALFVIPFFWLKPGEVDLGGDCSRLYFLDPIAFLKNYSLFGLSPSGITSIDPNYYYIPHLVLLQFFRIFWSPTTVIAITQGMKLSFSFIVMFLFIKEIIFLFVREKSFLLSFTSFIGALVYVSFITVFGWERSLISHNQVFINPFVAFMVLKYITTRNFPYLGIGIIGSLLFAPSFGFTSTPQIFSFFPLVGIFLLGYIRWIVLKPIPWKEIGISLALFACVHAFHLIPTAAPLFDIANSTRFQIFNAASKENPAPPLTYFEVNRPQLGKISTNIFQPSAYHTQEFVIFFVPVLILIAFIFVRNRLMALTGIFFVLTLFLVSANITQVGVSLYRSFFYLPGFAMFRSFNEKWYFVYVFFYTVLFAVSFYQLFLHKRKIGMLCVGLCIFGSIIYRTVPFLQGNAVHTINYQSKNVSTNFVIDPDLMETFAYVRTLPQDGKVITLPLTFPSYQIVFGKSEGAYVGLSMVSHLAGRNDFAGFWTFANYDKPIFDAFQRENITELLQYFSLLNIRYIFYNNDARVLDNFPEYPIAYPGYVYGNRKALPLIADQQSYLKFLASLPAKKKYEKGVYSIYEIDNAVVRPLIYIPDTIGEDVTSAMTGSNRSAYVDTELCQSSLCTKEIASDSPTVTYIKKSSIEYSFTIDLKGRKTPLLLVMSHAFNAYWNLNIEGKDIPLQKHVLANGYANGWIIDPLDNSDSILQGTITLSFQNAFYIGSTISVLTLLSVLIFFIYGVVRKRYAKT